MKRHEYLEIRAPLIEAKMMLGRSMQRLKDSPEVRPGQPFEEELRNETASCEIRLATIDKLLTGARVD